MARDFNQNRIANANLITKTIDFFGKRWALQDNADGYSVVDVEAEQAPTNIKNYLEGDNSIVVFPVASNINKLCAYALASYPNIETIYLFKNTSIIVLEDDLSYLTHLTTIYVPTDLLSAYQSAYPTLSSKFTNIVSDYTVVIEPVSGMTELTTEYLDLFISMLSTAQKAAISKLVISTDFTTYYETVWAYDFSELLLLNDNIWYGNTQFDFSEYIIQGSGELTNNVVISNYNNILSSRIANIEKVIVPVGFTSYVSGSINTIKSYFSYIETLTTEYSYGEMDIEIGGDIEQKIISLSKTLDEALVYAKYVETANDLSLFTSNSNLIIVPPFETTSYISDFGTNCPNLVYVDKIKAKFSRPFTTVGANNNNGINLVKIKEMFVTEFNSSSFTPSINVSSGLNYNNSIKYLGFKFENITFTNFQIDGRLQALEHIYLNGCTSNVKIGKNSEEQLFISRSPMDDDSWKELIESLGTPASEKTLNIGSPNVAKLSASTIAIATAKNWTIQ